MWLYSRRCLCQQIEFHHLPKLWEGDVLGSFAVGQKAGVVILLHKNLQYTLCSVDADQLGCNLSALLTIATREVTITNVYAVNSPGISFQDLSSWFLRNPEHLHILGRDRFKTVMDLSEDQSLPRWVHQQVMDPASV